MIFKMTKKITLSEVMETVNIAQTKDLIGFVIELNKENCTKSPKQFAEDIKKAYKHDAAAPYEISSQSYNGIVHVHFYRSNTK